MTKLALALIIFASLHSPVALAAEAKILARAKAAPASANLTEAEVRSLMESVQKCWNPPAGVQRKISVKAKLDKSGAVIGDPETVGSPTGLKQDEIHIAAAKRAVLRCQPYNLPAEKYDTWSEVIFNFDPIEMLQ